MIRAVQCFMEIESFPFLWIKCIFCFFFADSDVSDSHNINNEDLNWT